MEPLRTRMSTPNEEDAPLGNMEVLATIRQAMEEMSRQNAEFKTQIMEQQADLSSRIVLLTTTQDIIARQIALQTPAANTSSATDALPARSLESVLGSADRRRMQTFLTTTSEAGSMSPIKREPGVDTELDNQEDARTIYEDDVPPQRQTQQRDLLSQLPDQIRRTLPPAFTEQNMPEFREQTRGPTPQPLPIHRFNYNPTHDGLTGVIIGDQVPFEKRLITFDAQSVFMFLREVERYQDAYDVSLNLVNYVTEDILATLSTKMESISGLPKLPRTWNPRQLKIAMARYFQIFNYTPRLLCDIAHRVTPFPKTGNLDASATTARRAINQLMQVPFYCQRLMRFYLFVQEYRLLEQGWPTEHNREWGHSKRLNEVLAETLKKSAPQAYTQISDELTQHRKLPISTLLRLLPDIATSKIHDLQQVDETLERLGRTNVKPPDAERTPGQGRQWLQAPPTGSGSKAANFVSSKPRFGGPTSQGTRLNYIGEAEDGSEDDEQDTWQDRESALEPEAAPATMDAEEINALQAAAAAVVDRSKQICHSHLLNEQGCVNLQRGKPCPFSHDASLGIAELTKVLEKLKLAGRS